MTTTPAMPEPIAHVEDWPDDRTPVGLVWDVDPKSVPVGTKLYALATLQAKPAEVSDEPTEAQIAAGMRELFAGPKPWPSWEVTLKRVYQAMFALLPQSVPMTDEVKVAEALRRIKALKSREYGDNAFYLSYVAEMLETCPDCQGNGYGDEFQECPTCKGSGKRSGITAPAGGEKKA